MSVNSGYTNGLNLARVFDAMVGRLGWRQPTLTGSPTLSSDNTTANSGRYFNDFHALCQVNIAKAIQEDSAITDNAFNTYLTNLQKSCILRCINGVLNKPEEIERVLLFDRLGTNDATIENDSKFVGFEIIVAAKDDISVKIASATMLFDSSVTFSLYLFKDGVKTALKTKSCVVTAYESTVINFDDWVLNYIGSSTKGSRFYIGYFQDDLAGAKAIREQVECWGKTKCFAATGITADHTTGTEFDRDDISRSNETYGINLEICSFRDHTNAVVKQAALFDEVVGLQMAYTILEQIIYSTRSHDTERILKDQIVKAGLQLEMLGAIAAPDSPQITGLKSRIDRELKRIKDAFYPAPKAMTVNLC